MQNNKPLPVLSVSKLERLRKLFERQGWTIVEDAEESIFERYCRMLLPLDADEQDFLIHLSDGFLHIPQYNYLEYLLKPLKQLRQDKKGNDLLFAACLTEPDVGCVKSALLVLYLFKGTTMKQHINLHPYYVVENIQNLGKCYKNNATIVLVDDFIGTGDTALSAVNHVHQLCPSLQDNSEIVLLSIVAMQQGIDVLKQNGIKTYCAVVRKKGISEELPVAEVEAAMSMMEGIEAKQRKLKKEYCLGYKQSEALVCMERCPNNTFPIYWLAKGIAPYER